MHTTLVLELEPTMLAELLRDLAARGCQIAVYAAHGALDHAIVPQRVNEAALRTSLMLSGLTPRECDVVVLDLQGRARADIAASCGISPESVKKYWQAIYRKTGLPSRSALRVWARERVADYS